MKDNFDFLRRIFSADNSDDVLHAYKLLDSKGIEVYTKTTDNSYKIIDADFDINLINDLYVPAADWSFSKEILTNSPVSEYITEYVIPEGVQKEIDEADRIFAKKRKIFYIETIVVILIFLASVIFNLFAK